MTGLGLTRRTVMVGPGAIVMVSGETPFLDLLESRGEIKKETDVRLEWVEYTGIEHNYMQLFRECCYEYETEEHVVFCMRRGMEKTLLYGNRCLEEKEWGHFPPWITMGGVAFYAKNKLKGDILSSENLETMFRYGPHVKLLFTKHLKPGRKITREGDLYIYDSPFDSHSVVVDLESVELVELRPMMVTHNAQEACDPNCYSVYVRELSLIVRNPRSHSIIEH